jgi:hypothetical protein
MEEFEGLINQLQYFKNAFFNKKNKNSDLRNWNILFYVILQVVLSL